MFFQRRPVLRRNQFDALAPELLRDLAQAVEVGTRCFVTEERKFKNLVLITDGESHEEGVVAYALATVEENGIR